MILRWLWSLQFLRGLLAQLARREWMRKHAVAEDACNAALVAWARTMETAQRVGDHARVRFVDLDRVALVWATGMSVSTETLPPMGDPRRSVAFERLHLEMFRTLAPRPARVATLVNGLAVCVWEARPYAPEDRMMFLFEEMKAAGVLREKGAGDAEA